MKIKSYSMLLALGCSAFSCAMERELTVDQSVEKICYDIDKNILDINPDTWYKRLAGTYISCCKQLGFNNNPQEAAAQLSSVEVYIPEEFRNETVFQKLLSHWHVYFLFRELMADKLGKFHGVTGSTIDDLFNPDKTVPGLSQQMNAFILKTALRAYVQSKSLDKPVEQFSFDNAADEIHFTPLDAFGVTGVETLLVSNDGKYLKGITGLRRHLVWNVESGEEDIECMEVFPDEPVCSRDSYIVKDNYIVSLGIARLEGIRSIIFPILRHNKAKSEVFLFRKPTIASSLCQQALCNSSGVTIEELIRSKKIQNGRDVRQSIDDNCRNSIKELIALKNSQTVKDLKGFPQHNLVTKIDEKIATKKRELEGI